MSFPLKNPSHSHGNGFRKKCFSLRDAYKINYTSEWRADNLTWIVHLLTQKRVVLINAELSSNENKSPIKRPKYVNVFKLVSTWLHCGIIACSYIQLLMYNYIIRLNH